MPSWSMDGLDMKGGKEKNNRELRGGRVLGEAVWISSLCTRISFGFETNTSFQHL